MNKEEILKKAQDENKGRDLPEIEAQKRDVAIAVMAAYTVATVLCVIQIAAGKGINYGLYLVVNTISSVVYVFKAKRNPIWQNVVSAVSFVLSSVLFAIGFVIFLIR